MIYDCFPFYKELMLLEIRLHETASIVDKFVLVESTHTFSGNPKRLYYDEVKDSEIFAPFKDKIIHLIYEMKPKQDGWDNENAQRNFIVNGLSDAKPDDTIIVSDSDEMINPAVFPVIKKVFVPGKLHMNFFYYYFNCRANTGWLYTAFCRFKDYRTGHFLRNSNTDFHKIIIPNAGWHFAYLQPADEIPDKLESSPHSEYNTDYFKDINRIKRCLDTNSDIFERPNMRFSIEPLNAPKYVMENRDKYEEFIK